MKKQPVVSRQEDGYAEVKTIEVSNMQEERQFRESIRGNNDVNRVLVGASVQSDVTKHSQNDSVVESSLVEKLKVSRQVSEDQAK